MIHSRIDSTTLCDRLDASYYTPEVLANEALLRAAGSLELRALIDTAGSNYGVLPPSEDYLPPGTGVPLIRGGDLDGGAIRDPEIDAPLAFQNARGTASAGDVLLLIKGACIDGAAGVALVSERHAGSVFNGSCYRIKTGPACDAGFLVAFCQTRFLLVQKRREIANTGIAYNAESSVLGYLVLRLAIDAQRYVGDKVRQAEQLRERAQRLEAAVGGIHSQYIPPPTGIDFEKRTRRLGARDLTERLDAHFYPAAVEDYLKSVGQAWSLARLTSLLTNGQTQPEADTGVLQATVTNLGRSFLEGRLRVVARPSDNSRRLEAHDLLLCNAAHNKSYIGRDVCYCQVDAAVYPSTEVMVLRVDRSQVPASFVRQYLKSEIGYLQIQSTIRGITAHSYPSDVRLIEIPIPQVPAADRDAWFATDDTLLAAGSCVDAAVLLSSASKQLVEQLIEGSISEADLAAAQQALDSGDRTADRTLLQKLRQCDHENAGPLFADIDGLYGLLDADDDDGAGD